MQLADTRRLKRRAPCGHGSSILPLVIGDTQNVRSAVGKCPAADGPAPNRRGSKQISMTASFPVSIHQPARASVRFRISLQAVNKQDRNQFPDGSLTTKRAHGLTERRQLGRLAIRVRLPVGPLNEIRKVAGYGWPDRTANAALPQGG